MDLFVWIGHNFVKFQGAGNKTRLPAPKYCEGLQSYELSDVDSQNFIDLHKIMFFFLFQKLKINAVVY